MDKFGPAINQLKVSLDVMKTNEPINRREGKIAQADLERTNARSFRSAIKTLKDQYKDMARRMK